MSEYSQIKLDDEMRHSYIEYAMSVIVEHGGSGSSMAAPIAKDIMNYLLKQDTA